MTNELPQYVSLASSILAFVSVFYLSVTKIAKIEVKVDTMWDFMMRGDKVLTVRAGLGEVNSPLVFNQKALDYMNPLATELKAFYSSKGYKLNEKDLTLEVGRLFSDTLFHKVCLPNDIALGVAILIAAEVAKGVNRNASK